MDALQDMMITTNSPLILMYHGTPTTVPVSPYSLNARLFKRHLDYLANHGWHSFTVSELLSNKDLPEKSVAITFDDGYADNFQNAFLPLMELGMKATWFITTSSIGKTAHWDINQGEQGKMLESTQLVEMHEEGMEIASHSHTHPDLSQIPPENQEEEFRRSKDILEELLQSTIRGFAYPYGLFDRATASILKSVGYHWACSTKSGRMNPSEDPFQLRRITIFSGDSAAVLGRKLVFADNDVSMVKLLRYYRSRIAARIPGFPTENN